MLSLIKLVFIASLSFSSFLAHDQPNCLSLNDEPCMIRRILIDLNPPDLQYYSFMISLDKCTGSCNVLSPEMCVPKKTKDKNVKVLNMITNKNEAKIIRKHISYVYQCKFNSKYYCCNPSTCIRVNSNYLKSIDDTSVSQCKILSSQI